MAKKNSRGAPPKAPEARKGSVVPVRFTASEKAEVKAAAEAALDDLSNWARKTLLKVAREQKKRKG
jgi:hypothetical protein